MYSFKIYQHNCRLKVLCISLLGLICLLNLPNGFALNKLNLHGGEKSFLVNPQGITKIEAEDAFIVYNDTGERGNVRILWEPIYNDWTGLAVLLPDKKDQIKINFSVNQSGRYIIRVRVRSGDIKDPYNYWWDENGKIVNGYYFKLDGNNLTLFPDNNCKLNNTVSPEIGWGGASWAPMIGSIKNLTSGSHSLIIEAGEDWAGIDYIEIEQLPSIKGKFEAEDHFSILNDVGNNNKIGIHHEPLYDCVGGEGLALFDNGDKVKINFSVDQLGKYDLLVGLRSGDIGNSTNLVPFYKFTINAHDISLNFNSVNNILQENWGGAHWGIMKVEIPALKEGSHSLNIEATSDWLGVDYIQLNRTGEAIINTPSNINLSKSSIDEGKNPGTSIGDFSTIDADKFDSHTYSLVSGGDDFSISGSQLKTNKVFDYETQNSYSVTVRSTDEFGSSFDKTFTIKINNINEDPYNIKINNSSIDENKEIGSIVGNLSTSDPDLNDSHIYSIVSGGDDFLISGNQLKTKKEFDYETKNSYSIKVKVCDQNNSCFQKDFKIDIKNENESPTDIEINNTSIVENNEIGSIVGNFSTSDPDKDDSHIYALVNGSGDDNNTAFSIDGNQLKTKKKFDHETQNSYTIRVITCDQLEFCFEKIFIITIQDSIENSPPTDITLSDSSISESLPPETIIGHFDAVDPDKDDSHVFVLLNGSGDDNNADFSIEGNQLKTKITFDYEIKNSYTIRVKTCDQLEFCFEKVFTIEILDSIENSPPTDIILSDSLLYEKDTSGQFIGKLIAIDADSDDIHSFTIPSQANDLFRIDGKDSLTLNSDLDLHFAELHTINIKSDDNRGGIIEKEFNIRVIPSPKILSNNFPQEEASLVSEGKEAVPNIILDSKENVSKIIVSFNGIRSNEMTQSITIGSPLEGNKYSTNFSSNQTDQIGIKYQFLVYNKRGYLVTESEVGYAYRQFDDSNSPNIPNLRHGESQKDYQIFSIPFSLEKKQVSNVFNKLGNYNPKKWRLYEFKNGENIENGFGNIERGKGYWFISSESNNLNNIKTGAGNTTLKSHEPFELTLSKGWNLIGNPYDFDISWADIKACNPTLSDSIKIYNRGFVENSDLLSSYKGAFIYSDDIQNISFPYHLNVNSASNCRTTRTLTSNQPLDADSWLLPLMVFSRDFGNKLGGIGMHPQAFDSLDPYDERLLPRFMNFIDIQFLNHEEKITRDIAKTTENYTWEFNINTNLLGERLSLKWDNSFFGVNDKSLWLMDIETQHLIDMRSQNKYQYIGNESTRKFKIFYGEEKDMLNILPDKTLLGTPFPNPFSDAFTVPFTLPPGKNNYDMDLTIFDVTGKKVLTILKDNLPPGFYNIKVNEGNNLDRGVYLIQLFLNNNNHVFIKKIIRD